MSITIKKGVGTPTTNTAGFIGEIYEDTNTGNRFECTGMYKTTGATAYGPDYDYIWEKIDVIPEKFLPEGMGGGASSWNDLKDRPFYDESVVYFEYVDGYTPIESVEVGDGQYLYKVSNTPLTKEELIGAELMFVSSTYGDSTEIINEVDESIPNAISNMDGTILSVSADVSADGVTSTTGLWVYYSESMYLSKVYKPSIKKLDAKFLPEHIHSWKELTNKPFGELIAGEYTTWVEDCYATGNGGEAYIEGADGYLLSKSMHGLIGKNVRVTLNGDVYESVCYISPNGRITVEAGEYIIGHMVTDFEPWIAPTVEGQRYDIKIEVAEVSETKLPIKYIPDELYTEIDNRINAIIEEALGGAY